jgi:hypothetical protein
MNVEELRRALLGCPDDALVVVEHSWSYCTPLESVDPRVVAYYNHTAWDPDKATPPGAVPCIRLHQTGNRR